MPEFDRILTAYEHRLRQLADELVADLDPSPEERVHLALVTQLVQAIIRTYDSFQITRPTDLDASTSVMYAAAGQEGRGILNVPLRSLVDSGTLSPAQARYLNGSLGMRRSIFISGGANVGKSTVLNALIGLLPGDMRLAIIRDDDEELLALRGRPVVVQFTAQSGTPDRKEAFRQAGRLRPDWVIVDQMHPAEGPLLLETLTLDTGALATIPEPNAEASLSEWLGLKLEMMEHLADLYPLAIHLERDRTGRPRISRVVELALKEAGALTTRPRL
jgi:Flp pilus assembly CpaF family ATPase